jgi:ligand-binding sensor domain-containing protein/class 3 adenylate cyclase/HD superfamily phosphodiesterase
LKQFLLFCSIFLLVFYSRGQGDFRFNSFTISNGLSQSFVTCIIQDNTAALWIGTQDGLNRFDGKNFEIYNSDDTPGIGNSFIKCVTKSKNGNLWFGTANGLLLFEPNKEKFTTFLVENSVLLQIESISIDDKEQIWLSIYGYGVVQFNSKTKTFTKAIPNLPTKKTHLITSIGNNTLLIDTEDKGLLLYQIKEKKTEPISFDINRNETISTLKLVAYNKVIYIGTNKGVFFLNVKQKKAKPLFKKNENLNTLIATDIVKTRDKLFIATASDGLITIDKNNKKYFSTSDIFQKNSLISNNLTYLFKDNIGKIWVGSERGISSFDPYRTGFLSIGPSANLSKGLPSPNVWSFASSKNSTNLFIGTDVGVSRWNRQTGTFDQFNRIIGKTTNSQTGKEVVLCIHELSKNKLLIGSLDGLYELNILAENNYQYKKIDFNSKTQVQKHERVYSIVPFSKDEYFLATNGGVVLYNYKTRKSEVFEHNQKDKQNSISLGVCRLIYKDPYGKYWFATSGGGINYLNIKNGKKKIIAHPISEKLIRISKDYVSTICSVGPNKLWLGTFGSGLIFANLKNNYIRVLTKKDGLPNNVIYGLLKDDQGRLWFSTNRGIGSYSLATSKFHIYTEKNGLVSDEFNSNSFFKTKDGEIYFGGIEGFNHFFPTKLTQESDNLKVWITHFKIANDWLVPGDKDSPLTNVISKTKYLELDYKHRSFTIRFHANDLSNPLLINYKYQLIGSDLGEQLLGPNNELTFNALSPGDYTLKIYARLGDGKWSKSPTILQIKIKSPFWGRIWFWVVILIILGFIIFLYIKGRIELSRREQVRLEIKIAERTSEIRLQKSQIEEQNKLIEEKRNKLVEQQKLLQIEKDKTEKWLNNTLPAEAVRELKQKGKVRAQSFKTVSVLFTDVVGFSLISERTSPNRLVHKLDVLFQKFDEIIEANNLEKIKTIGDAYMCAGGVPTENSTNPIDACIAALQIQAYMSKLKFEAIANHKDYWEIRIGINTGPVTAGIIGNLRLAYDIWGSTVNLAQQMEMLGKAGHVAISGNTFHYVEPYFEGEYIGKVTTKTNTQVDMYSVHRIKPELSVNGEGLIPNSRFGEIVRLHHFSSIKYYKTERHVLNILQKNLSDKLYYHSINHTKDVVKAVERIALLEGVTDEGLFLLKTAAILHDAGFIERYEHNEPIGARMATEILPKYGYTEQHIKTIVELIHVTEIPHRPINKLQEIICDADLDYLGRDDFEKIADRLRLELREMNKINSDRAWDNLQVKFLNQHQYFTKTAKKTRQKKKEENLISVLKRLERDEYVD